ncbi:MAG: Maf family nucleotide pyrophosphatase [Betaproteobacteria bacterium]|nr:Maf family nucleotide pyrophosphatase [Betaproteobacteria bacterium]
MLPLILASASPFRRELLAKLGLPFTTLDPACDETPLPNEEPRTLALRLSEAKAQSAAARLSSPALIIGSDQVVVCKGVIYGKPGNHERAVAQLRALSGETVDFFTGLCLFNNETNAAKTRVALTRVTFRALSDAEIERYLAREPAYESAGAAKCEGLGITLLARLEGEDPNALIGLPLIALCELLREAGIETP